MADEAAKPKRSKEAIVARYNQVLKEAGEAQYRIKIDNLRLDQLNKELYELNMEAAEIEASEKKLQTPAGESLQ